jgi:hypothetical protein
LPDGTIKGLTKEQELLAPIAQFLASPSLYDLGKSVAFFECSSKLNKDQQEFVTGYYATSDTKRDPLTLCKELQQRAAAEADIIKQKEALNPNQLKTLDKMVKVLEKAPFYLKLKVDEQKRLSKLAKQAGEGDDVCIVCKQAATNSCSKCLQVKYCSKKCKKNDFSNHSKICDDLLRQRTEELGDHEEESKEAPIKCQVCSKSPANFACPGCKKAYYCTKKH